MARLALVWVLLLAPWLPGWAQEAPVLLQGGTDALTLALGFESDAGVKAVFGKTGPLVPGRHGNGLSGLREWIPGKISAKVANAAQGTVMGWLQLCAKAQGGFHQRWLKTSTDVSFSWGSDEPLLLGVKVIAQKPFRIETGDWHHWAYVWQERARKLYIDGELVIDGDAEPLAQAPGFIVITEENGLQWVLDDFKLFSVALPVEQVRRELAAAVLRDYVKDVLPVTDGPVQAATTEPVSDPAATVLYDERQLVANPTLALRHHGKPVTQVPPDWLVTGSKEQVLPSAACLTVRNSGGESVSVAAELRRSVVRAGAAYQVGLRYALKKQPGARVLLRFRNQIDQGTREMELAESAECRRHFFWLTAPDDYDVGLYYLEVQVRGGAVEMEIRGAYAREATDDEVKRAKLSVPAPGVEMRKIVRPDERWLDSLPVETRFLSAAALPQAWMAAASDGAGVLTFVLRGDGSSLLLERTPAELWGDLTSAAQKAPQAPLRLAVSAPNRPVPGGYGLDPLPARGTLGAALLFGVGAVDTGAGSYVHGKTVKYLEEFGLFCTGLEFLPFWGQKGVGAARVVADSASPPDFQELWGRKEGAPLFAHSAPGVLVSGYRVKGKLLLVVANATNQELGKFGNLWVDLNRLFEIKGNTGGAMRNGQIVIRNPETGREFASSWNRASSGYIGNWLFNVAVPPGDFVLIEIRQVK